MLVSSHTRALQQSLRRPIFRTRAMSSTTSMTPLIQNLVRPQRWKAAAPSAPAGTSTYGQQDQLPRLPVPELLETATRLKESLRPLARSSAELAAVEAKIGSLTSAGGLGPVLQKRLEERQRETPHWLEEWWDDGGYLGYRDSVVVNVSYYYGFNDLPSRLGSSPAELAAGVVRSALLFREKLKNGQIAPDAVKDGAHCMDTWRWMFDACRIPGAQGLDWSVSAAKQGDEVTKHEGHVIVLRKGRFWKVDVAPNGHILSSADLAKQFKHIYENTDQEYPAVGVLTSANRDLWAKDYTHLASDPHNAAILADIHSSAFAICLDTEKPEGPVQHSRYLWHGAGSDQPQAPLGLRNRWVDKPVQFIVFDNGKMGIMGEHSVMDGTPTARMCDEVLNALHAPDFDHGEAATLGSKANNAVVPQALDWHVTPQTEQAIRRATGEARELIESQLLGYCRTSYGKKAIKTFGVSPDSWAQMVIQLAYARLLAATGKAREGGTYEAASTRKFFKGRTEAIRVVSEESDRWVASMTNDSKNAHERRELFALAAKKHIERAKLAGNAQGVDRHLLGLRYLVREDAGEAVPELYTDPLYLRAKNWVLSTSAIHSKHFTVYGWGEVVPTGFGVAYTAGFDDRLQYTVTSRKEMPNDQFCNELVKAADDIYRLFEDVPRAKL